MSFTNVPLTLVKPTRRVNALQVAAVDEVDHPLAAGVVVEATKPLLRYQ